MFWRNLIVILILMISRSNGKCSTSWIDGYEYHKCISTDEEQLLTFIRENVGGGRQLSIENSFIPQIEILPVCSNCHIKYLTIRHSRVRSILPLCRISRICKLDSLDLGFNDIRGMSFLDLYRMEHIDLSHNQIEYLNSSGSIQVTHYLDLSYNKIRKYESLGYNNLKFLNLSNNFLEGVTELFNEPSEIRNLDLSYNRLNTVVFSDFKNLLSLHYLNLSHNNIHSMVGDIQINCFFMELDLSYNKLNITNLFDCKYHIFPNFYHINLENNSFEYLKFFSNKTKQAHSLIFRNNRIKKLFPSNFKDFTLNVLDLSWNEIDTLPSQTFKGLEVRKLYLNHNKITSLNLSNFAEIPNLSTLNLSYNPLIIVNGLATTIQILDLSHCLLTKIPDNLNFLNLSEIHMGHNNIDFIEPNSIPSSRIEILDLSHNKIKNLKGNTFSGSTIQYLDISQNDIESLEDVFQNTTILSFSLSGLALSKISHKDFVGLNDIQYLNLSNTGIKELCSNTFDQLKLKNLYLDNNSIQILPSNFFDFNVELEILSITQNPLSLIPLDVFPHKMALKYLYLTIYGRILKKRFFNLIFLEELHIIHSKITELHKYSFKGLISLKTLNFNNSTVFKIEPGAFLGLRNVRNFDSQNLFSNISILKTKNFVGLEKLDSLNLSNVAIATIEDGAFFGLNSLINLTLSHNRLGDLPKNSFVGLKTLKMLDLSHNNLTGKESTFPIGIFKDLVQLTHLHLQHNRIIKFHIGEFSNLRHLKFLNLSHNQLSYLDRHLLFPLRNLEVLDINSNHVIKFDYHFTLKHLMTLRLIGIGNNKFPCENMTIMLNVFEDRGVDYREISKLEFDAENIGGIYCVHVCNYLYCPTEEDLVVTY